MFAGGGREVGVDGDFDEVGAEDVGAGFEDDGDGRDGGLELVGMEIAKEASHEATVVGLADDIVVDAGAIGLGVGFRVGLGLGGVGLGIVEAGSGFWGGGLGNGACGRALVSVSLVCRHDLDCSGWDAQNACGCGGWR